MVGRVTVVVGWRMPKTALRLSFTLVTIGLALSGSRTSGAPEGAVSSVANSDSPLADRLKAGIVGWKGKGNNEWFSIKRCD